MRVNYLFILKIVLKVQW